MSLVLSQSGYSTSPDHDMGVYLQPAALALQIQARPRVYDCGRDAIEIQKLEAELPSATCMHAADNPSQASMDKAVWMVMVTCQGGCMECNMLLQSEAFEQQQGHSPAMSRMPEPWPKSWRPKTLSRNLSTGICQSYCRLCRTVKACKGILHQPDHELGVYSRTVGKSQL